MKSLPNLPIILIQEPVATVRSKYIQVTKKMRDTGVDQVQFDDVNYSDAEVSGSESEESYSTSTYIFLEREIKV